MREAEFAGLALVAVASYHLVSAFMTGAIPSRWPMKPVTRAGKPGEYRFMVAVMSAAGVIGAGILLAALLKRMGL